MNETDILEQQAIDAAISLHWEDAIALNMSILKIDPKNGPAHLRLGFVYLQTKDLEKAKKYYSKALRIQPKNSVATQNLERIGILEKTKSTGAGNSKSQVFDPELFIEMTGKTKIVGLSKLGQKNVLAELTIGQKVELKVKKRRVEIRTGNGQYVGTLPDDVSNRLMFFMKAKSEYSAYIKDASITRVMVFLKEEKKGRQVNHYISFPQNIQKSMGEMTLEEEKGEEDTDEVVGEDWEKLVSEATEEKEELIDIHTEDEDDEEE